MITWVISDLDGTLYRPDKTIDAMDAEAVRRWIASGRHFALASGRPIDSAREIQKEYGIVTEAMLSDSGATLHIHDQLTYESVLPKSSIQKIYDIVEPYGKDINIISRETEQDGRSTVLMYYDGLFTTGFHHNWPTGTYLFKDWLSGPSGNLKKLFLVTKTHELQTEVIEKLKEQCGEELDIATSDVCYAEICAKGTNKGSMLLRLAELENLDLSEFAAIGDEENDISMLKLVGRPFVMAHARESVKKYGQIVSSEAEMIEILLQEAEID